MNLIDEIDDFINQTKDPRELKRAIAVKLKLQGKSYREIQDLLQVSQGFISNWKNRVIVEGVDSLKLQYKGRKGYLSPEDKQKVIEELRARDWLRLSDLQILLEREYGVVFQSEQSYYNLLEEARISWKKSQKKNPAKNEQLVQEKKEEIEKKLESWKEEIEAGKLMVFLIDECHLLWGDLIGYIWGRTDQRIEIPMKNPKERQTYYGALNYQTKEFIIKGYSAGNTENTVDFLHYLQQQNPRKRLAIVWDNATYHCSQNFRDYLTQVNQNLPEEEWGITCLNFAPNAPEQNPVEDLWLQTKNFVRKFYHLCPSFKAVKELFEFFAQGQIFNFPKLFMYGILPQPI